MVKKSFPAVTSQDEAWDDELGDWQTILESEPFPLTNYANIAALPAFGINEDGLAIVDDSGDSDYSDKLPVFNDGSAWRKVAAQASAVSDLSDSTGGVFGGTINAVSGTGDDATINNNLSSLTLKINAVLSAMKNNGTMAS